jgi:hypothetical protein
VKREQLEFDLLQSSQPHHWRVSAWLVSADEFDDHRIGEEDALAT